MQNYRARSHALLLTFLLLLLPLSAQAELTPVGAPLVIAGETFCSFITDLEVTATPKGAFEVVWADDAQDFVVKGQRFARNLTPTGTPQTLLPLHGGLTFVDFVGTWTNRYEVALNAVDTGNHPADPLTGYRVSLDLEGEPLAPTARFKPPRFFRLAPAADGDSLQFRSELPIFGPPSCQSLGLLGRRIDESGTAITMENRVTRQASAFSFGNPHFLVERLPNDTFVAAYATCDKFDGLVARRLNAGGAPIGKPINLPMPARLGNFAGGSLALAARGGADFAVAAMVANNSTSLFGGYTRAVVNGQVFGPTRIPTPAGVSAVSGVVDMAASPSGGYLLLFQGSVSSPQRITLFAQELDARGVPQGTALAVTEEDEIGAAGAVASLPNGRWIVVTRVQRGEVIGCSERVEVTILEED